MYGLLQQHQPKLKHTTQQQVLKPKTITAAKAHLNRTAHIKTHLNLHKLSFSDIAYIPHSV